MPAEWARHRATWLAWPHHVPDWPGKFDAIPWVYAEIVRALADHEPVELICHDADTLEAAREHLEAHAARMDQVRLRVAPTDRVWLRDSAWAKYDNYADDARIPEHVARWTGLERIAAQRHDSGEPLVLEGGGIEVNGSGRILVTEEWLLSDVQVRNPGYTRADYERAFAHWLGCHETIWLGEGCVGDDTHGHIDDIARFVAEDVIVIAHESDPADENHARSADNLRRLARAGGDAGRLKVITLPFPRPVIMDGVRLPASYANFYIANGCVLVPTFNDANDRVALNTLAECFPDRRVIGIHAVDLVWGLGTLHCLSQQEPAPRRVV